jgi:hypothetical protein
MTFDVRAVFKSLSDRMRADFERSSQIQHGTGKGSVREQLVRTFLREQLPAKYAIGQGQIIHPSNRISRQVDVVIYDGNNSPRLLVSDEHSIFPIESVYGIVAVKSVLTSAELAEAFGNIVSTKELVDEKSIVIKRDMLQYGLATPFPVGIVFAFAADRSLEAIAKQARELQNAMSDPRNAPDLIVVLGEGLVGPREQVRVDMNKVKLPAEPRRMAIRQLRHHTLLRFYLQMLSELNAITLPPLVLEPYLSMPEIVDGRRVSGHGPFLLLPKGQPIPSIPKLTKIGAKFIRRLLAETATAVPITYAEHLEHLVGNVNLSLMPADSLAAKVIEYNPRNLPSMKAAGFDFRTRKAATEYFAPHSFWIDDQLYAVDTGVIQPDEWETPDVEFDEVFDQRPVPITSDEPSKP